MTFEVRTDHTSYLTFAAPHGFYATDWDSQALFDSIRIYFRDPRGQSFAHHELEDVRPEFFSQAALSIYGFAPLPTSASGAAFNTFGLATNFETIYRIGKDYHVSGRRLDLAALGICALQPCRNRPAFKFVSKAFLPRINRPLTVRLYAIQSLYHGGPRQEGLLLRPSARWRPLPSCAW